MSKRYVAKPVKQIDPSVLKDPKAKVWGVYDTQKKLWWTHRPTNWLDATMAANSLNADN